MDAFTRLDQHQYEAVQRRVRELQASLPKAVGAYYDGQLQQVVVELSSRLELRFSPEDAEGLEHATSDDLERIEITGLGFGIHFPKLDVDLSVPAVLLGRFGSKNSMRTRPKHAVKRNGFGSPLPERNRGGNEPKLNSQSRLNGEPRANRPKLVDLESGKHSEWHGLRAIAGGLTTARAPERTDAQVEKYQHDGGSDEKHSVIRAMGPARPHAPEIWSEGDDRQEKEGAGNFEPEDASHAAKGPQKTADAPGHAGTGLSTRADGLPRVLRMNSSVHNGLRASGRGSVRTFSKPLSYHATGDPYADSQDASNRLWSHPIYDGSSDSA